MKQLLIGIIFLLSGCVFSQNPRYSTSSGPAADFESERELVGEWMIERSVSKGTSREYSLNDAFKLDFSQDNSFDLIKVVGTSVRDDLNKNYPGAKIVYRAYGDRVNIILCEVGDFRCSNVISGRYRAQSILGSKKPTLVIDQISFEDGMLRVMDLRRIFPNISNMTLFFNKL